MKRILQSAMAVAALGSVMLFTGCSSSPCCAADAKEKCAKCVKCTKTADCVKCKTTPCKCEK